MRVGRSFCLDVYSVRAPEKVNENVLSIHMFWNNFVLQDLRDVFQFASYVDRRLQLNPDFLNPRFLEPPDNSNQ